MTCSLSMHNSTTMEKWWCNTGKGVIRVKMDDNKGGHLTHCVNARIYEERGWWMGWVIAPKLDEWVMKECLLSHKKMSHRNIHQYQGEKHLGHHCHGILLFSISSCLLIFFSCFVLSMYSPHMFLPCHCHHHWGAQALNNKMISFHRLQVKNQDIWKHYSLLDIDSNA